MRSLIPAVICLSCGVFFVGPRVRAADAPPAANAASRPAAQPANGGGLRVTIVEVNGNVQVRASETDPWQTAKVGAEVGEGAELRTMPKSSVRCTIAPDQTFTLDRLGVVKVAEAARRGNKIKTDLMMKYGRTKLTVEAAGEEHESTISSPGGSLAVGGTVVSLYDQPPFTPEATSYTGRAQFRDLHRQVAFGGKGQKTTVVRADHDSAADTALANSVVDPQFAGARTNSDAQFIASEVARGGIVSYDSLARITVVRNSPPLPDDKLAAQVLPRGLEFVARWSGNADVNLEVVREAGDPLPLLLSGKGFNPTEFLYPGYGLDVVPSGGKIPFDHRGGPSGGMEIAYWLGTAPHGVYGLAALLISGNPVDLKVNAFLNGQKQFIYYTDKTNTFDRSKTLVVTLDKTSLIGGPLVFIPNVDDLLGGVAVTVGDGAQPTAGKVVSPHTTAAAIPTPALAPRDPNRIAVAGRRH